MNMERSVTVPLNEYENLRRRADRTDSEIEAEVDKRVQGLKMEYNGAVKWHAAEVERYRKLVDYVESYAAWAYARIRYLEVALEKAYWLGGRAKATLRGSPQMSESAAKGEARAMRDAYIFL